MSETEKAKPYPKAPGKRVHDDLTDEDRQKLRDMLEYWEQYRLAIKFLLFMGKILKWGTSIAAAGAVIWSAFHGGTPR